MNLQGKKNIAGVRIREARLSESPKATQKDLSARLETQEIILSENSIGKIEMGSRPITDVQLMAFANALKVSAAWLLGITEQKQ